MSTRSTVLVLGGGSDIAAATVATMQRAGHVRVIAAARDTDAAIGGLAMAALLSLAGCVGQTTAQPTPPASRLNVDGISVVIQEGVPAEVTVDVHGTLPNGCY